MCVVSHPVLLSPTMWCKTKKITEQIRFLLMCDGYDSQYSQNLIVCVHQANLGSCICYCFRRNVFLSTAGKSHLPQDFQSYFLAIVFERSKKWSDRADEKKGKKKRFYLCTSCKLKHHRPMGNQCTDCCCEWNVWRCNPKNVPTWLQTQTNRSKWGHTQARMPILTQTHTHIQGQLNKKQINRVSFG